MNLDDYPKTMAQAKIVASQLKDDFDQLSPLTEVATVADISFLLTQGYITASTRRGAITVIGCPVATVVPGTDIFVRRISNTGINQYVFDGVVLPTLVGPNSGAIVSVDALRAGAWTGSSTGGPPAWDNPPNVTNVPANAATTGWFWSFFFYTTALPSTTAPVGLINSNMLEFTSGTYNPRMYMTVLYNYLGQVGLAFYYNSPLGGTITSIAYASQSFAPGKVWFVQLHLGNGMAVNGVTSSSTTLANISSIPVPIQGYVSHELASGGGFNAMPPIGSWVSKFTFGYYPDLGVGLTYPYALNGFIPNSDSQIISASAAFGAGMTVYDRVLVSDGNSSTLPNTGVSGSTLHIPDPKSFISVGPY